MTLKTAPDSSIIQKTVMGLLVRIAKEDTDLWVSHIFHEINTLADICMAMEIDHDDTNQRLDVIMKNTSGVFDRATR